MWREEDWTFTQDPAHAAGPMWMDAEHVEAIYHMAMACGWRHVLELGCWDGFSTSAIVQAKIDQAVDRLTCVDREIRPALWRVLGRCRDAWGAWQGDSRRSLELCDVGDCVILDTDHDLRTTQDEFERIRAKGWPTIIAHDVGAVGGCPGPQWMLAQLLADPAWIVLVDDQAREGTRTDRGLMLATMEWRVFTQCSAVWTEGRVPDRGKA